MRTIYCFATQCQKCRDNLAKLLDSSTGIATSYIGNEFSKIKDIGMISVDHVYIEFDEPKHGGK